MKTVLIHLILPAILFLGACQSDTKTIPETEKQNSSINPTGSPVQIFYGLNDSNSTSWSKHNSRGILGTVYFRPESKGRIGKRTSKGTLIYRTTAANREQSEEIITEGENLEISVLLYDTDDIPHIFTAESSKSSQTITHFHRTDNGTWLREPTASLTGEGGVHIYELSAVAGPDNIFHLSVLKTISNPDSPDYLNAYRHSHLYYIHYRNNKWHKQLISRHNTLYTLDEYSKGFRRQDIAVDSSGNVHIIFGEEVDDLTDHSSTKLHYATNRSGEWITETAMASPKQTRHSVGWYSSLAVKNDGTPALSCCYISRVPAGSASSAKLLYLERNPEGIWHETTVCKKEDDYFGSDGKGYTGALTHLLFDSNDTPHIVFTDIASSHNSKGINYLNLGNIRYAVLKNEAWSTRTIYRHNRPESFYKATEIYNQCISISEDNRITITAQELTTYKEYQYTVNLIHMTI